MSKLLEFTKFLRDRQLASDDVEDLSKQFIETVTHPDGSRGYRIKAIGSTERISQRCKILVYYTWHCRDYVKKILEQEGQLNPGQIVNTYIEQSRDIQVLSYLANQYKHAGTDASQKWAADLIPRYGKPFIRGVMFDFPFPLKPTVMTWGDSISGFEFVGFAGIDDLTFHFQGYTWTISCMIEDKNGKNLGHATAMCESVFETWLKVLSDHGAIAPTNDT